MKNIKKLFSVLFVVLFALMSVVSPVSAAKGNSTDTNGTISINNAVNGEDYSLYQMLKIASYDVNASGEGKVSYIVTEDWYDFFASGNYTSNFDVTNSAGNGEYYVILKSAPTDMEQFAKDALKYAKDNNIAPTSTKTAADNKVEWTDLDLGYYLVESTVGVICSLSSTTPSATIEEKNETPNIEKEMNGEVTTNSASIGDIIDYKITLTTIAGKKNVKVVDTISEGLTYYDMEGSFIVKNGATTLEKDADYTLDVNGNTFTLTFKDATIASMAKNSTITIEYKAQINENAQTNVANTNDADLSYGKNTTVDGTPTKTYTYGFKINKTDGTASLADAQFKLYDAQTGGNEIKVVLVKTEGGVNYYRVATAAEEANATTIVAGEAQIDGLAEGTYYLEEISAPEGYNKLAARVEITISTTEGTEGPEFSYENQEIVNTTGPVLPSTGGIGTIMFIVVGSIITIIAGVALITKYRLAKENA